MSRVLDWCAWPSDTSEFVCVAERHVVSCAGFVRWVRALVSCVAEVSEPSPGLGELEDYNLNGAGFYAVFVALIPTGSER